MLSRLLNIALAGLALAVVVALGWSAMRAAQLQADLDETVFALVQEKRATEALEATVAELEKSARLARLAQERMRAASLEMEQRSRAAAAAMEEWRRTHEDDLVDRVPLPLLDFADILRCRNEPGAEGCDSDENGPGGDPEAAD